MSAGMNLFSVHTEKGTLPDCWWKWKLVQLAHSLSQKLEHVICPSIWGFQFSEFILGKPLHSYTKFLIEESQHDFNCSLSHSNKKEATLTRVCLWKLWYAHITECYSAIKIMS